MWLDGSPSKWSWDMALKKRWILIGQGLETHTFELSSESCWENVYYEKPVHGLKSVGTKVDSCFCLSVRF